MVSAYTRRGERPTNILFVGLLVVAFALRGFLAGEHIHNIASVGATAGPLPIAVPAGPSGDGAPSKPPVGHFDHCLICNALHGGAVALPAAYLLLSPADVAARPFAVARTAPRPKPLPFRHRPRGPPAR